MENYCDEKLYLNNDKSAIDAINLLRERYSFLYALENWRFGELLRIYNHYLLQLSNVLSGLDLSGPMDYSIAMAYLIKNGYLSYDKDFKDEETKQEVHTRYGTSIINGYAVCRNYSDINRDILMLLDMYVKNIYCYRNPSGVNNSIKKSANHVVNLIEYDGVKYGIDLFNDCQLFKFDNSFILSRISDDKPSKMRYKPYFEIIVGDSTLEDVIKKVEEFDIESKKETISSYEYENGIKNRVLSYMKRNRDIFEDFHRETNEDKEEMVRLFTIDK